MFVSFNLRSLGGLEQNKGGFVRWFPARRVTRGRGKVGENGEEVEVHLLVVLDGSGAAGRWVAGEVRGGGHGSSAPAGSGEVGKGWLGLGASAF